MQKDQKKKKKTLARQAIRRERLARGHGQYSRDPFLDAYTFKMAAKQVAQTASKTVFKPLLSTSHVEARRRVMNLYRAWWREVLISVLLTSLKYF